MTGMSSGLVACARFLQHLRSRYLRALPATSLVCSPPRASCNSSGVGSLPACASPLPLCGRVRRNSVECKTQLRQFPCHETPVSDVVLSRQDPAMRSNTTNNNHWKGLAMAEQLTIIRGKQQNWTLRSECSLDLAQSWTLSLLPED